MCKYIFYSYICLRINNMRYRMEVNMKSVIDNFVWSKPFQ